MEYIYDIYKHGKPHESTSLIDSSTRFEDFEKEIVRRWANHEEVFGIVKSLLNPKAKEKYIEEVEQLRDFRESLERASAWKPERIDELPLKDSGKYFVEDDGFHTMKEPIDPFELVAKSVKKDPVNPAHYKSYLDFSELDVNSLQWLEVMCRIPRYRDDPESFIAALELQIRKYLDRSGRKDSVLQDLSKGLWYYKFMVAFIKAGKKPILVQDIDRILSE
jgi:hypothetical protein